MARPRTIPWPTPEPDSVADRLGRILKMRSMTPRAASLAAKCHADTLRNVLRGRSKLPRGKTLVGVTKVLGVSEDMLLGRVPLPDQLPPLSAPQAPSPAPQPYSAPPATSAPAQPPMGASPQDLAPALQRALAAVERAKGVYADRETMPARRTLMSATDAAVQEAVAQGLAPEAALRVAVQAAMMSALGAGVDMADILDIVASCAGPVAARK